MERAETRKTYLDAVRILACFGVIYNHVAGTGVINGGAPAAYGALFGYFLSKMAVPLFFMITGALLLPRIDTYKKSAGRFCRIAIVLALFYAINYALYCVKNGAPFDVGTLVLAIYRDRIGITYSYWYLYRYLSILVMLPVLQRMTARLTKRDIGYFLLFAVGLCGWQSITWFFSLGVRPNENLAIPLFSIYIGMLLTGYWIDRYGEKKRGYALLAGAGLLLLNAFSAYIMQRAQAIHLADAAALDRCDHTSVVLAAGCCFYLIKCLDESIALSARVRSGISRVGRLTFAVYLVSEMLIDHLTVVREWLQAWAPVWGANILYSLAVFAVGTGIAALLTRIPLLKKLL